MEAEKVEIQREIKKVKEKMQKIIIITNRNEKIVYLPDDLVMRGIDIDDLMKNPGNYLIERGDGLIVDWIIRKIPEENEITKEQLIDVLEETRQGNSDWCIYADAYVDWLLENPNSKTFQNFLEWVNAEGANWDMGKYREGDVWKEFFGSYDLNSFCEDWVDEEDVPSFKKFFRERYGEE
jgi:hypothetical protein